MCVHRLGVRGHLRYHLRPGPPTPLSEKGCKKRDAPLYFKTRTVPEKDAPGMPERGRPKQSTQHTAFENAGKGENKSLPSRSRTEDLEIAVNTTVSRSAN